MAFSAPFFLLLLLLVPSSSQGSYSQVRNALALALWKSHVGNLAPFLIALHNANETRRERDRVASIILERNDRPTNGGRPRTSTTCRLLADADDDRTRGHTVSRFHHRRKPFRVLVTSRHGDDCWLNVASYAESEQDSSKDPSGPPRDYSGDRKR